MEKYPIGNPMWTKIVQTLRMAGCVFAEEEAQVLIASAANVAELEQWVARRVEGYPLEHIVGWVAFGGLKIVLDPGVFVPRQRTEFLAEQAVALVRADEMVVDLCCGSGALGAVVRANRPGIRLYAVDIDPAAVQCARRNIRPDEGTVFEGDLFEALPAELRHEVNVIIANAPYVPSDALAFMPTEARVHEASCALDGGADGLDVHRRIVKEAALWLAPGGVLIVETSERQAPRMAELMTLHGLLPRTAHDEERDAHVVIGQYVG
ncbi:putative protein N(5)-glutamine methyltransferase [Paenibacillus athensensis]|uniref:peptide chain release factor N(5)-glutamine methyltransferase n=1 Tax=Paenibacillus athensensis TaxID=1967502 RepID=A0A4Y8Q4C0_9BACL|nr:putative protein N(5)-glutamine methyltransferase [Paenibacillus athensensis]MCD1260923.1 putative protein N(5)-glutamine methyltransferase [Paenibacillus athensensis]